MRSRVRRLAAIAALFRASAAKGRARHADNRLAMGANLGRAIVAAVCLGLIALALPAAAQTITYTYDPLGRLTASSYSTGTTQTYVYDAADNRSTFTMSNGGPVAVNDNASAITSTAATISVLANDSSPSSYSLTVTSASAGSHGTTTVNSGTTVTYTPTTGYTGPDAFTYAISDGHGGTASATVSVTVSSTFTTTIHIASGTSVNLRTLANSAGYSGASPANITYIVDSGVTVYGAAGSYSGGAGGAAIDSGSWPTGSYSIALSVTVASGGTVLGGGGGGGDGGAGGSGTPGAGGGGGDAIYCQVPMSVTVNSGGYILAGGGGGGGGAGVTYNAASREDQFTDYQDLNGGFGGGGAPNGNGVHAGAPGSGGAGTAADSAVDGDGNPAQGDAGGAGGGYATSGTASDGAGGAAGYAVRKNGHTVTVTNNGTATGTIG
jgi:YD repeat-containing protein